MPESERTMKHSQHALEKLVGAGSTTTVRDYWSSAASEVYASLTHTSDARKIHQVSWRHPRSGHWHQLDLVITQRADLPNVLQTRSFHSADCDTDHTLIASKGASNAKRSYTTPRRRAKPHINTCCTTITERTEQFISDLEDKLNVGNTEETTADTVWPAPQRHSLQLRHQSIWEKTTEKYRLVRGPLGRKCSQ
jgi:hypothetical protein